MEKKSPPHLLTFAHLRKEISNILLKSDVRGCVRNRHTLDHVLCQLNSVLLS